MRKLAAVLALVLSVLLVAGTALAAPGGDKEKGAGNSRVSIDGPVIRQGGW